jgi:hypothetical protein
MKIEKYLGQKERLPKSGKQIIGQSENGNIIVYQAFNPKIANYAVENQCFGGVDYSFSRMSWIKPNFLWMMYRAGWASKEHQQYILAITISLENFKKILTQATISSFDDSLFDSYESWKQALAEIQVRLQWDPDHNPYGNKEMRKAIQLGMKGDVLKQFCTEWIIKIENITPFVLEQYEFVKSQQIDKLYVPVENVVEIEEDRIIERIGIKRV